MPGFQRDNGHKALCPLSPSLWRPWLGETSGNTPPEVEGAN
eukprot:COSAG03_NODE_23068_length_283_cov_1.668478_1_plen_40_part_01